MSPSTRVAVESFWEYVAFALNSVVFLLIGFEVRLAALLAAWKPILVAFARRHRGPRGGGVVTGTSRSAHRGAHAPRRGLAVLTWGGLRGGPLDGARPRAPAPRASASSSSP
jgi:CPA1 family monovalent cation:H+ antiporter